MISAAITRRAATTATSARARTAASASAKGVDEAALVEGLRRGDPASAAELVRWLSPRMLAAAFKLLGHEEDARDAVQDAFVRVVTSIHQFRGEARLSTWVLRIVVNSALMLRRRNRSTSTRSLDELLPAFAEDGHRLNPGDPWPAARSEELRETVRECLDALPEDARTILMLRDALGIFNSETARILRIRSGCAKTRLHRARQALRELVVRRLPDGGER